MLPLVIGLVIGYTLCFFQWQGDLWGGAVAAGTLVAGRLSWIVVADLILRPAEHTYWARVKRYIRHNYGNHKGLVGRCTQCNPNTSLTTLSS